MRLKPWEKILIGIVAMFVVAIIIKIVTVFPDLIFLVALIIIAYVLGSILEPRINRWKKLYEMRKMRERHDKEQNIRR